MQSTNQPAKFLIPFAQNDSARVEIPATTSDPTRFSQEKGSPPLTGMPPEAGGVPPQLEDFNGALNQIARGVWWALGGGRFAYDSTWATDSLIGGYARGAVLPAALGTGTIGMGEWYNNAEANTADPDAAGTGWVPGYHYGTTSLAGQAGGTVTLTPAQAAKRVITVAGTLTSNLVLVVPAWVYSWRITNNTGGSFTVTVKNAATSAVEIPQNGAPTIVNCDGTQVSLESPNIAPAVSSTQPMQYGQAVGRLLNVQRFITSGTYTPTPGTATVIVEAVGGGGSGGATAAAGPSEVGAGGGGGSGAFVRARMPVSGPVAVTVGAGASSGTAAGGVSSFGAQIAAAGGTSGGDRFGGAGAPIPTTTGPAVALVAAGGTAGANTLFVTTNNLTSGAGAASHYGGGPLPRVPTTGPGLPGLAPGAGGSGAISLSSSPGQAGGTGADGQVLIYEYS